MSLLLRYDGVLLMKKSSLKEVKFAFINSLPVLFGFIFLGIAFGILLQKAGFNYIWAFFTSLTVYAGSLQFVLVSFLSSGTALPVVALTTLFINSRHMFYGLSFIETFKSMGKRYPYMIFSLTDETYSALCSLKLPDEMEGNRVRFLIALFNQSYWIIGSVLGALIGRLIPFGFDGIEFSMTALFVVILVERWKTDGVRVPAIVGLICGIISLLALGAESFLLPALSAVVAVLLLLRPSIEGGREAER